MGIITLNFVFPEFGSAQSPEPENAEQANDTRNPN